MARNSTRAGRRRRVLNEEVLSATNIAIHTGSKSDSHEPGDTPRYGAGANIENHPQVTSFVPRRLRVLFAITAVGIGVGVAAEATEHYADSIASVATGATASEIVDVFANRLVAWTTATLLLLTAACTRLIYSLRRHRVDDVRGRYRVWRTVGWASVALSLNAVLGSHTLVARYLGNLVQWQLLPNAAGWWLIPAALVGGWMLVKVMIDSSECRGAVAVYALAAVGLAVAGVHSAGWSPAWTSEWPGVLSRSLPLVSLTMLLVGSLLFARYVVLDVQGLIERSQPTKPAESTAEEARPELAVADESSEDEVAEEPQDSGWVDGSEPEYDYDDEPTRKLSKAQRKRLRKQKQRKHAA